MIAIATAIATLFGLSSASAADAKPTSESCCCGTSCATECEDDGCCPPEVMNAAESQLNLAATPIYVCPMHPEVTSEKPGVCPKCSMKLELKPAVDEQWTLGMFAAAQRWPE